MSPADGGEEVGLTPTLSWTPHPDALGYVYQVFTGDECVGTPLLTNPGDGTGSIVLTALTEVTIGVQTSVLPEPGTYAWRSVAVSFVHGVADGLSFAPCFTFTTGA